VHGVDVRKVWRVFDEKTISQYGLLLKSLRTTKLQLFLFVSEKSRSLKFITVFHMLHEVNRENKNIFIF